MTIMGTNVDRNTIGMEGSFLNSSGIFFNIDHTTGATLSAININTTPPIAGVRTLRKDPIWEVKINVAKDPTHTKVNKSDGPPKTSAEIATLIKSTLFFFFKQKTAYEIPIRLICNQVEIPQANRAAKTNQL